MSWVRLDDGIFDHEKIVNLSDAAQLSHVRGIVYCARNLTDGRVPMGAARKMGTARALRELIPVVWHPVEALCERCRERPEATQAGDGYYIHDYLDYNPTRLEVEEERRTKHEAKARSGRSGGIASGVARRKQTRSETEANAKQSPSESEAKRSPVPDPDPLLSYNPSSLHNGMTTDRTPTDALDRASGRGSDRESVEVAKDEAWKLEYLKEHPEGIVMTSEEMKRGRIDLRRRRKDSAAVTA